MSEQFIQLKRLADDIIRRLTVSPKHGGFTDKELRREAKVLKIPYTTAPEIREILKKKVNDAFNQPKRAPMFKPEELHKVKNVRDNKYATLDEFKSLRISSMLSKNSDYGFLNIKGGEGLVILRFRLAISRNIPDLSQDVIYSLKTTYERKEKVDNVKAYSELREADYYVETYEYNLITMKVNNKNVKEQIIKTFETLLRWPYIITVSLQVPFTVKEIAPANILKIRNKTTTLDRTQQNLKDESLGQPPGECMIDLFYNHCKGHKTRCGRYSYEIGREYIKNLFCKLYPDETKEQAIQNGFNGEDADIVARQLNFKGLMIYEGDQLSKQYNYNQPLLDNSYAAPTTTTCPGILAIVLVDNHPYKFELKLARGIDRKNQRPGVKEYNHKNFKIVNTLELVKDEFEVVYIRTEQNILHEYFLKQLQENRIITVRRLNDKDMTVVEAIIDDKLYIHTPDIDDALKLVQIYNIDSKRKPITYEGQSLPSLLMQYGKSRLNIQPHRLSPDVHKSFQSLFAKNYGWMGWMSEEARDAADEHEYVDMRQAYQSCLNDYQHMGITPNDEWLPFSGTVLPYGIYFIYAPQIVECLLFNGPGYYYGTVVLRGLIDGIITTDSITHELVGKKPGKSSFAQLTNFINEQFPDSSPNLIINKMIGVMQNSASSSNHSILYTTSWEGINAAILKSQLSNHEYKLGIHLLGVEKENDVRDIRKREIFEPTTNTQTLVDFHKALYVFQGSKTIARLENYLIPHYMTSNIIHLKIYDHIQKIAELNKCHWRDITMGFNVDSIAFRKGTILEPLVKASKKEAVMGDLVKCNKFQKNLRQLLPTRQVLHAEEDAYMVNQANQTTKYVLAEYLPKALEDKPDNYFTKIFKDVKYLDGTGTIIEETPAAELIKHSVALIAMGGYGKTYTLAKCINEAINQNIPIAVIAYTHTARENIDEACRIEGLGQTASSFLGYTIGEEEKDIMSCKWTRHLRILFIDEFSLIPSYMWIKIYKFAKLYNTTIIIGGDPGQLPPIGEDLALNPYRSLIKALSDNNYLTMKTNWIIKNDPGAATFHEQLLRAYRGDLVDFELFGKKHSSTLSIVATNELRQKINAIRSYEQTPDKSYKHPIIKFRIFVGMPIICFEQIPKTNINNGCKYIIQSITDETITITRKKWNDTIDEQEVAAHLFNNHFEQFYSITCDKAMGQTFRYEYTIYEKDHFLASRPGWLYTAMGRASQMDYLNFGEKSEMELLYKKYMNRPDFAINTAECMKYIYSIKEDGVVKYIGQTENPIRRCQEHMENGIIKKISWRGNFLFEIIHEEICNTKKLNILEKQYIEKYNTIENGYNQLNPPSI